MNDFGFEIPAITDGYVSAEQQDKELSDTRVALRQTILEVPDQRPLRLVFAGTIEDCDYVVAVSAAQSMVNFSGRDHLILMDLRVIDERDYNHKTHGPYLERVRYIKGFQ